MKKSPIAQSFLLRTRSHTADMGVPSAAHVRLDPQNAQWMISWIERAKEMAKIDTNFHCLTILGYIVKEYVYDFDGLDTEECITFDELSEEQQADYAEARKDEDEFDEPEIRFYPDGVRWFASMGSMGHLVETDRLPADVIEGFLAQFTGSLAPGCDMPPSNGQEGQMEPARCNATKERFSSDQCLGSCEPGFVFCARCIEWHKLGHTIHLWSGSDLLTSRVVPALAMEIE